MRVPRSGRSVVVGTASVAVGAALLALATRPALAQSVNKAAIRNLNLKLLYLAVPLAVAVEFILLYTVYRYRNNDDPEPRAEDRRLEITWTIATALVLVFVGVASLTVLGNPYVSPTVTASETGGNDTNPQLQGAVEPTNESALVVKVTAYQWGWEFTYPEANVTTQGEFVLPTHREIYLHLTSREVLHSLYVPDLGFKQDVFPDQYNTIRTNITESGSYQYFCAEFCGSGHSRMRGEVDARSQRAFESWLDDRRADNATAS